MFWQTDTNHSRRKAPVRNKKELNENRINYMHGWLAHILGLIASEFDGQFPRLVLLQCLPAILSELYGAYDLSLGSRLWKQDS
jgi:hypothetical protein